MPKRLSHLSWKNLGEFTLILDSSGENKAHQLNEVASFIFERCDGVNTKEDVINALLAHFDCSEAEAGSDLDKFLTILYEQKLISPTSDEN